MFMLHGLVKPILIILSFLYSIGMFFFYAKRQNYSKKYITLAKRHYIS
jgi:hypothetical protein